MISEDNPAGKGGLELTHRIEGMREEPAHSCSNIAGGVAIDATEPNSMAGLSETQKHLVEDNIDLVGHVVLQVAVNFPRHVERDELKTAGNLGLVEAASRYDQTRGVPFPSFATPRIRGAILDSVRKMDWAPRSVRKFSREVEQVEQMMASETGEMPSEEEIAEAMGISLEELRKQRAKLYKGAVLALEYDINDGEEDLTLAEVISAPDQKTPLGEVEDQEIRSIIMDAVKFLPYKHRYATVSYYLQGVRTDNIAEHLGVTPSRITQLRQESLEMIRHVLGCNFDGMEDFRADSDDSRERRKLTRLVSQVSSSSSWRDRITGPHRTRDKDGMKKLQKRAEINKRGTVTRELHPAELRKVLGYFLFNDNARLEELRRANPEFDYIDMARFSRIRNRISRDLAERGVDIIWDTQGRTRGTRYTIRIKKGSEILEDLIYDDVKP